MANGPTQNRGKITGKMAKAAQAYRWIQDNATDVAPSDPLFEKLGRDILDELNKGNSVVCLVDGKLVRIKKTDAGFEIKEVKT